MYKIYKIPAVLLILGTSFATFGPGLSARSKCIVKPSFRPLTGTTASKNTRTPMPPTQWLKLLQYSIPFERPSTFDKIDAPVVVKPDTISNNPSRYDGISREIQNGRQPKRLITIHASPTQTIPSLA